MIVGACKVALLMALASPTLQTDPSSWGLKSWLGVVLYILGFLALAFWIWKLAGRED